MGASTRVVLIIIWRENMATICFLCDKCGNGCFDKGGLNNHMNRTGAVRRFST